MKRVSLVLTVIALLAVAVAPAAAAPARDSHGDIIDIAVADGRFETLAAAVTAAGLVDTLKGEGPFTVFAPTDDAFAALPEGTVETLLNDIPALTDILLYHVVEGTVMAADAMMLDSAETLLGESVAISVADNTVKINDATVIIADVAAENGVIHVIDAVLLPPTEVMAEETEETAAAVTESDLVDIAVADGRFETLAAAVTAAGLVDTLKGEGPFTVFAPTDDAFAALPEGTVEALLNDIPALTDILLYHVVPGKVMAEDVVNLSSADSALGQPLSFKVEDGSVMVNDANVIITDIEAANGVIHVVDSVLIPVAETQSAAAEEPATLPETGGAPNYALFLALLVLGAALVLSGTVLGRAVRVKNQ
jgi:transforming growth factor-beta-induced protein